ncbi:hypothetical protein [Glycomyces tarimensis]
MAYQTGSDGTFQRRRRAGEYEITATLEPDATATETTTVQAGQTVEVELTLHASE